jgi:hypothetical protein
MLAFQIMPGLRSDTSQTSASSFLLTSANNSPFAAAWRVSLQLRVSVARASAHGDAERAILTDHTAPEGVVAIHHQDLARSFERLDDARNFCLPAGEGFRLAIFANTHARVRSLGSAEILLRHRDRVDNPVSSAERGAATDDIRVQGADPLLETRIQ